MKSQWKHQLDESDPAYMWAQCMAPTYGINILGTRAGLSFRVCASCLCKISFHTKFKYTVCLQFDGGRVVSMGGRGGEAILPCFCDMI